MKLVKDRKMLFKVIKVLKWGRLIAKIAALGTTISGAITALSGSATTGAALSVAGATTYAATKGMPGQGYEKTKHIPPGRVNKSANLLRHYQLEVSSGKEKSAGYKMAAGGGVPLKGDASKKLGRKMLKDESISLNAGHSLTRTTMKMASPNDGAQKQRQLAFPRR